jgi:NitT/TauT family transport system permease protein
MIRRWPGFVLIAVLLVAWEYASAMRLIDPVSMPRVSLIAAAWLKTLNGGALLQAVLPTLGRIFAGLALAALIAVPLGLLMGSIPMVYRLLEPATELIRPIPSSAYIPVAILFLGIDNEMKVFVIVIACLFPILLNTYGGVRGIDPVLIDTGRTFGLSRAKALWQIVLPAALPQILTGLQVALPISLIVAIVAEMAMGGYGLGGAMMSASRFADSRGVFAGIVEIAIVGYGLIKAMALMRRRLLVWHQETAEHN